MSDTTPYKVLVWGDSIARQHSPTWVETAQASMDVSVFPGRKVDFVNIAQCGLPGVVGQTWFEEKVCPETPNLVILEFGFNDLRHDIEHGGKAIGTPDEFFTAMCAMIRNCKSIGADVLVLGIHDFWFGNLRFYPTGLTADQTTEIYRSQAKKAAELCGADYIDMKSEFARRNQTPEAYTLDGCHLSPMGRCIQSHVVTNYLLQKLIPNFQSKQ